MRRLLAPLVLTVALLGHVFTGGCSSESSLTGGGGCESFCTKWVGARCRNGPTKEACLDQCREQQTRCLPEANAFLKCATVEAQIACETGSGQPRVVGCLARENSLNNCLLCDRFCEGWSALGCPLGPTREECVATCLDQRCQAEHLRIVDCNRTARGTCGPDGRPIVNCPAELQAAALCTSRYDQPQPFRYLAVDHTDSGTGG